METTFTKISVKGEGSDSKVALNYRRAHEMYEAEFTDAPLDSFLAAMRKFDNMVAVMVDLPPEIVGDLKCHTINIGVAKSLKKVTLSATKKLGNGKAWNFNTPMYIEAADPENPLDGNLPPQAVGFIKDLLAEAQRYLDGERSQMSLPLDEQADSTEAPPSGEQTTLSEVDSDTQMDLASKVETDDVEGDGPGDTPPETSETEATNDDDDIPY